MQATNDNKSLNVPNIRKPKSPNQNSKARPKSTILAGSMTDSMVKFDDVHGKDKDNKAKNSTESK